MLIYFFSSKLYGPTAGIAEATATVPQIPKPALNAFAMLHRMGTRRIAVSNDSILATRLDDGGLAVALWNYVPPVGTGASYTPQSTASGPNRTFTLHLEHLPKNSAVILWRVDGTHGNVMTAYDAMGRPATPSQEQIAALRKAGKASPPEHLHPVNGTLSVTIPAQGLVVLTTERSR